VPVPDPTTTEWVAAGVAVGLVVVLAAVHLVRPVLAVGAATAWGRVAGLLLAVLAAGLVLAVVVLGVGAARSEAPPEGATPEQVEAAAAKLSGPFASELVPPQASTANRVASYSTAALLPLAAALAVLAVAVIDVGRPSGIRLAAGAACGLLLVAGGYVVTGGTQGAARAAGWAAVVLAACAAAALVVDELEARRG
jgi:hypothetical protein